MAEPSSTKDAQFVVGIDLGTTHCAMAAALLERPRLVLLAIPQLTAPGEVSANELLPSFLYLPTPGELGEADRALPWGSAEHVVGKYARTRGAKSPGRLVASAKSWICHGGVNRRAAILPFGAPDEEAQVSPFEAQVAYLKHLRSAWCARHPDAPLERQDVVVTVPASFDEGARMLTREAATEAGLGEVRLLEEPQAAFYDYLGAHADGVTAGDEVQTDARKRREALGVRLSSAKLILVVDVGGGTTDLTLLRVLPPIETDAPESQLPPLERIAVGGHLMLGGDNMDAALAMFALEKAKLTRPEDATVWAALVQSARDAKERLLSEEPPDEAVISYQGRGSRLVGNTRSITVTKEEAERVLLDGCFPCTGPEDVAQKSARAGLTTLGLPYSSDTAVPRHVCSFLRKHVAAALEAEATIVEGLPRPDLVLLNGGVFNAPAVVSRFMEVMDGWYPQGAPTLLEHRSLDTAVALGAVRSGLARRGRGTLIGGGTARAYYIGIEHQGRTVALCVAPRNADEGSRVSVRDRMFQLRLNEPVRFPLFTYTGDRVDEAGALVEVENTEDELQPLPPLETLLRGQKGEPRDTTVNVSLESYLDDSGSLHLELVSAELPPQRWRLQFVVRSGALAKRAEQAQQKAAFRQENSSAPSEEEVEEDAPPHPQAHGGGGLIRKALATGHEAPPRALRTQLEESLGPRGTWSGSTCRVLADALLEAADGRSQSSVHELAWLRLLSWTLRPGFGIKGDTQRIDRLWALQKAGCLRPSKENWGQWWLLWRRVAAGLNATQQAHLFEQVRPSLWGGKAPAGPPLQGPVEMMRMIAAFERLSPEQKVSAGELFLQRTKKLGSYWPLGRVGARVLFHGHPSSVIPRERAEQWLTHLLALDWKQADGAAFAAASIARRTDVEEVDVSPELREQIVTRLGEVDAPPTWTDLVLRPGELGQGDVSRLLGDSLPTGLRLT